MLNYRKYIGNYFGIQSFHITFAHEINLWNLSDEYYSTNSSNKMDN
ncbi:hypothetical protein SAMN05444338_10164 [Flavobacterium degerlachei]|uniref:Uncharacterized protein n=1 Tax=Flavobacterium degerlachei TaxID=229203 RepID=A0A1H2Q2R6_9FLAO|nr:hypothetical protein SAMN05444338_10164 [Flavobacterium degerlachei]